MGLLDIIGKLFSAFGQVAGTVRNSNNYLVNFTVSGSSDWDGEHYMRVPIVGEYSEAQAIKALRMMNGLGNDVVIVITKAVKEE